MKIEQFPAGPLDTNGYLVSHEGKCVVVDPSLNPSGVISAIQSRGLELETILLTHAHFDHFLGIDQIIETFGERPIWLHDADRFVLTDPEKNGATWVGITTPFNRETIMYTEGSNTVGSFTFEAIFTPGHTPGGVCLLFGNDCLTGDTLFRGSVGRSDFPYSDTKLLFRMIDEKLMTLSSDITIWPGHGSKSTIGHERIHNPYLR